MAQEAWATEDSDRPGFQRLGAYDMRNTKASVSTPIERELLEDVRGFVDDPEEWFRTPNAAFEGRRPIELLGTPDESRLRNRIEAAKLGMFS